MTLHANTLPIQKFNMDSMVKNSSILLVGSRCVGRFSLIKNLLNHFGNIPEKHVFSQSENFDNVYRDAHFDGKIHDDYHMDKFSELFDRQRKKIDENSQRSKQGLPSHDDRTLVILDDSVTLYQNNMKNASLKELLCNGRHYNITLIVGVQCLSGLSTDLTSNFDYVFMQAEDFYPNRRRLYEHYCGMIPSYGLFCEIFDELTKGCGMMVVNNRDVCNNFVDKIFWHKVSAQPFSTVTIGKRNAGKTGLLKCLVKAPQSGNDTTLPVKKFKFDGMAQNSSILLIGKRGTGKTCLTKDLLYHFDDIPEKIVFSSTDGLDGEYIKDTCFKTTVYDSYNSSTLDCLLTRQKRIMDENIERSQNGKQLIDCRALVVLDSSVTPRLNFENDKALTELLYNGRHYNITCIVETQYSLGLTPSIRTNFDYVFLFSEDFPKNKTRLYDHYCGMFRSYELFSTVLDTLTADYGLLVVKNHGASADLLNKIFWYRVQMNGNKKRGLDSSNMDEVPLNKRARLTDQ